jgi:hypothetical protein
MYIVREGKRMCARHYANDGLRSGDKVIFRSNNVYRRIDIDDADDKRKNFEVLQSVLIKRR